MKASSRQPGLFDKNSQLLLFDPDKEAREARAEGARARMRAMIDRLSPLTVPPWTKEWDIHMEGGAFKRECWLVPPDEAEKWLAEYNPHYERLFTAFWDANPLPEDEPDAASPGAPASPG